MIRTIFSLFFFPLGNNTHKNAKKYIYINVLINKNFYRNIQMSYEV